MPFMSTEVTTLITKQCEEGDMRKVMLSLLLALLFVLLYGSLAEVQYTTELKNTEVLFTDDDNDGTLDINDAFPLDENEDTDTDADGTGNNTDTDDDNDGQTDADETPCGRDPLDATDVSVDTDSDTIPDSVDTDDDTDGTADINDAYPSDENVYNDTSNDGTGKHTNTTYAHECT